MEELRGHLSRQSSDHTRELAKREAEREIVFEDLEALNDQYQQLNMAFEAQAGKLAEAKVSGGARPLFRHIGKCYPVPRSHPNLCGAW